MAVYNGMLFVGGRNGHIAVFNTSASPMTRMRSLGVHDDEGEYEGHIGKVRCLKVHDGKLHSGGDDSIIKIWDCESFELLDTLTEHLRGTGINSLAIYNDQLISGASSIRIWSCEDYSLIASICTGGVIEVFKCEGLHLSAIHGDPEACTLSVKDLRARVLEKKRRRVKWTLPNGKSGGYNDRDIEKLSGKGPNSPLVRLYNTYVRATRDLSDAERAAPFCHNITFPTGEED